jgi:alpha-tubulin suppressor-like RCC1 family protein
VVSVGESHTCGVKTDNTADCWGRDDYISGVDPTGAPSGTFVTISAGSVLSCAVRSDHTAVCWGDNFQGAASPPQ